MTMSSCLDEHFEPTPRYGCYYFRWQMYTQLPSQTHYDILSEKLIFVANIQ